jgi:hypothetical protein
MYEAKKDSFWTEKALNAAKQAQTLNDKLPEVHFSLGRFMLRRDKRGRQLPS